MNEPFIRTNNQIRVPQVRLIGVDGSNQGLVNTFEALKQAKDLGLDLVEINGKSNPSVAKIMDYGKYCYEQAKKDKESRKNQRTTETREIDFRPMTDEHDIKHKLAKARELLEEGCKLRLVMRFRGREMNFTELGRNKLESIIASLSDLTANHTPFSTEGKQMITILSPKS
jgi:translation initiation factor IF-3